MLENSLSKGKSSMTINQPFVDHEPYRTLSLDLNNPDLRPPNEQMIDSRDRETSSRHYL